MKRRVRKIANFFAFNLLFFALYLNFIHNDKTANAEMGIQPKAAAFSGTVVVDNPELNKQSGNIVVVNAQPAIKNDEAAEATALKLSIN